MNVMVLICDLMQQKSLLSVITCKHHLEVHNEQFIWEIATQILILSHPIQIQPKSVFLVYKFLDVTELAVVVLTFFYSYLV